MSVRHHTVAIGLLAVISHPVVWAQDDASRTLVEQGRYWVAQGKPEQAAQAWEKLLLNDPGQPDALYGMAAIAVEKRQYAQAREYLARLKSAAPDSRYVPQLEQDLRLSANPGKADIDKARLMAQDAANSNNAQAMHAAVAQYDKALGGKTPQGDVAREYYTYLGYTDGGLEKAIQGLQRLDRERPGDPAVMLPLAQHMARNERTRADGIRRLQQLADRPDIGGAATEFWRTALTWLGAPRAEEKPLFEAYLAKHPDDSEIASQMKQVRAAAPATRSTAPVQDPRLARGYAALKRGDTATAEAEFAAKLRETPNNADALGGLGVVRMQQNRLPEAERLLASAAARPGGASWTKSLNSARYWNLLAEAGAAQDAGDLVATRKLLDQAQRLDAKEATGRNAVARLQVAQGDLSGAEKTYRSVLATDKSNRDAIRGLAGVLSQTGRADQAVKLVESLSPSQRAALGDLPQVRAEVAAGKAKAATARGDTEGARRVLEDAVRDDGANPWLRLELARHYLDNGKRTEARRVVDELLAANPDQPDALYASTLLSMQMGDWGQAQQTLARIPASARTSSMASTEQQLNFQLQLRQASELGKSGQTQQAQALLARLEPQARQNPALAGAVAQAYADAGDTARGAALMRQQLAGPGGQRADVLLPYAAFLVKTQQDAEAASVLRQLQAMPLTPAQARQQEDLVFLYTVRQADLLRQRGELAEAYDTLAPALNKRPNDPLAVAALARMYAEAGDAGKALALYDKVLANDPANPALLLGAAQVASQAGKTRYSNDALERAVAAAPSDPDILAGAARVYRANGKSGRAAELLTAAIAAKQQAPQTQVALAAAKPDAGATDNPFRARTGVPSQALAATVQELPESPEQPLQSVPGSAQQAETLLAVAPVGRPTAELGTPGLTVSPPMVVAAPQATPPAPAAPQAVALARPDPLPMPQPVAPAAAPTAAAPAQTPFAATPQPVPAAAPAQAIAVPSSNTAPQSVAVPVAVAAAAPRGEPAAGSASDLGAMQNELREIHEERSPEIRVGAFVQSNNGTDGTSRLTLIQEPVEARMPVGEGKLVLRVTPVQVKAGSVGSDVYHSSEFGGGPQATLAQQSGSVGGPGSQRDSGVGLAVGYETKNLTADIGTTPLGFTRNNVVGGVDWKDSIDPQAGSWYSAGVSRRAVTDSLLSFAGTRDSRTGDTWGGVTATGLSGQIGVDKPTYGVYGYGSWQYLDGSHVQSNNRTEVGAGVYRYLIRDTDRLLTAGLNLGGTFYNRNERFFTYGHGGYFSPQEFYALSVPITWAERFNRFSYKLQGSIGVQHFRESGADYFPTSSARQQAAEAAAASLGLGTGATYGGQSKTGVGYSLSAAAEYQLANNWFVGASVGADNASDYRQWAGGLYLRYSFYPQTRSMDLPVVPYRSPYSR
ncbi:cellulose biosynthesis protein BcsC [Bordetella genomosp. 12]|uniref:Cellulose synthase operon C C-terminal domain-containing protein n=1 Tax=Bordetella genomosp. 12 TaxID=463035 RepID=A0A261VB93_9BORD|nr:cellulose biosynthesis protein BcsC [Bordetella genomosp. 12]OZI70842.1 hypothetical protein CAL22_13135 [Bordetella genomosp. 12]